MSTSSAGTHVNFGSQELPEPAAPGGGSDDKEPAKRPDRQREAAELELEAAHGAAPDRPADGGGLPRLAATSSVAAEAQQGDGPAAASASGSAVGETDVASRAVSVVIGPHGAAAACELGVAVVGPQGAAAASNIGVASAGPGGAAAAGNGANSSTVAIDGTAGGGRSAPPDLEEALMERLAELERENRLLREAARGNGGQKSRRR